LSTIKVGKSYKEALEQVLKDLERELQALAEGDRGEGNIVDSQREHVVGEAAEKAG